MLARRLMSRGGAPIAEAVPAGTTHVEATLVPPPVGQPPIHGQLRSVKRNVNGRLVAVPNSTAKLISSDVGAVDLSRRIRASIDGRITLPGENLEADAEPDFGTGGVTIFATSASGLGAPLQRLPLGGAAAGMILCGTFAISMSSPTMHNLLTGAQTVSPITSNMRWFNSGESVVALLNNGSITLSQYLPTMGFSLTQQNGVYHLLSNAGTGTSTGLRVTTVVASGYNVTNYVANDFPGLHGAGVIHNRGGFEIKSGFTMRYGSAFAQAEITQFEVAYTGGVVSFRWRRQRGLARFYPDGTIAFQPWYIQSAGLSRTSARVGTTGLRFSGPGGGGWVANAAERDAWVAQQIHIPITETSEAPSPVDPSMPMLVLPDRLVTHENGSVDSWSFTGVKLASHPLPVGLTFLGIVDGENCILAKAADNSVWHSYDAGLSWSPEELSPGEIGPTATLLCIKPF